MCRVRKSPASLSVVLKPSYWCRRQPRYCYILYTSINPVACELRGWFDLERENVMGTATTTTVKGKPKESDWTLGQLLYILDPWGRAGDWIMQSVVIRTQGKGVFIVLKRTVYETGDSEVAFVGAKNISAGLTEVEEGLRLNGLKWKPDKFATA